MLQSSNQYLRPDYLAAPTALDTKSSPLALLAQTCSAIGADTTNPKLLAANIEKSTKSLKSSGATGDPGGRDKSSPVSSHSSSVSTGSVEQQQIKSSFKPYEPNNNINSSSSNSLGMSLHLDGGGGGDMERATNLTTSSAAQPSSNHRVRTPKSSNGQTPQSQNGQLTPSGLHHGGSSGAVQRCDSNQSATSQRDSPAMGNGLRRTPSATSMAMDLQQRSNASPHQQQRSMTSKESAGVGSGGAAGSPHTQASPQAAASRLQAASDAAYAAAAKENYVKALHAAAAAAASGMPQQPQQQSAPPTTSAGAMASSYYPGYPSVAGGGGGGGMPYPMDLMTASALMSPHHPMFKSAALHPYFNYARLKSMDAAAAAAMMVPNICRDPYCTGCPSSPHYLNKAAGQPCPAGCPQCEGGGGSAGGPPGSKTGGGGGSGAASSAAAAAAASYHAQLAALAAASQMPYVCSWIGGDTAYCGKRFGTSDELFQHLRTHTASMPDSVLSAAAAGGIPPNHPLFQRTYPTPPLSPLSAARYHPYGKPSMLPPTLGPPSSLAGMPMPPHPALAQYFSPYALYGGPRMGSSHP